MKSFKNVYDHLVKNEKIKENYKKVDEYTTDSKTSKMWINPKGVVINLHVWHHQYILANAKKLKIPITHQGEEIRKDALNVGYFRVNYLHKTGTMIIEGKREFFNKTIKDAIFGLLHQNLKNLWIFEITLFSEDYKIVAHSEVDLFQFDDSEKLDHIPLITESLRRKYQKVLVGV
jgi:hypothetical protein